jgi:hypothetical protein
MIFGTITIRRMQPIIWKKRMKAQIFRYLNGVSQFYRRTDHSDIYVMLIFMFMECVLIICFSVILNFRIPASDELGNKWVVRLGSGSIIWLLNKYIFGVRESVYSEYRPFSKWVTLLITLIYFTVTLGFLFFSSKNH